MSLASLRHIMHHTPTEMISGINERKRQGATPEVSAPTAVPDVAHNLGATASAPTVELPVPVETSTEIQPPAAEVK